MFQPSTKYPGAILLSSNNTEERITALSEALNYGEAGLNLLVQALKDESERVQNKAYSLLMQREEESVKRVLHQYKPWQFFEYLRSTNGHSCSPDCAAITPDAKTLVTSARDSIKVWNLDTGKEEALNYGETGLNLLVQALKDESEQVQNKAYSLLRQIEAPNIKQILHNYKPWQLGFKNERINTYFKGTFKYDSY